jgi:hypothetical protein
MNDQTKNHECCPKFDPELWDAKIFQWENKRFIKDKVHTIFFMPLNFGQVMRRLNVKVEKSGATIPDWLCLSDHTSMWNMDLFLAVDKDIENAEIKSISGKFYSKVYEGPFKDTGKWCKDFEKDIREKGFELKKMYMWYTTCPKCAKKYGKNYVVIIGNI